MKRIELIFQSSLLLFLICTTVQAHARVFDGFVIMDQEMNENLCALTFDDGPSTSTPYLLDLLEQYSIPATFFMLGKQAKMHPETVRRIINAGHEIGNHTYSHKNLRRLSYKNKWEEIRRSDEILRSLGAEPLYLRPPYGSYDAQVKDIADRLGVSIVLWSLDSRDWQCLPDNYATLPSTRGYVYKTGELHGIFLFHDTHQSTVEDLPRIIAQLREGGCERFVTVSQYLAGNIDPEPALKMTRRQDLGQAEQTQEMLFRLPPVEIEKDSPF